MGETEVKIDNNDIMVDDVTYEGTPGLWNLIMDKDNTKKKIGSRKLYRKCCRELK